MRFIKEIMLLIFVVCLSIGLVYFVMRYMPPIKVQLVAGYNPKFPPAFPN